MKILFKKITSNDASGDLKKCTEFLDKVTWYTHEKKQLFL